MGRFINADGIIGETGELLSHNIFANFNAPSGYLRCALDYEGGGGGGGAIAIPLVSGGLKDCLKGLGYALVGTATSIVTGRFISNIKAQNKAKIDSLSNTISNEKKNYNKRIVKFPKNPHDFKPRGLKKIVRAGTKNGSIIQWRDPVLEYPIFEWDEDLNHVPHYHIMPKEWKGKHGWPDKNSCHFYPGMIVPEPFATFYFK